MLSTSNRLTASKDIMKVLRTGQRTGAGPFVVYALRNQSGAIDMTRMTVVISKKVDKRAVVRNRCRRRVREAFRPLLPQLEPGFDILIYIKQDMGNVPFEIVTSDVTQGCRKLGLLK